MQERLDGRLLVSYQGKVLTPEEAPPLAASLRARADVCPEDGPLAVLTPSCPAPVDPENAAGTREPRPSVIWYEDSAMKSIHRELVKAGMHRARQQGKRIGRPRVTEQPEFPQRFAAVVERIGPDGLSRRQAAKALGVGFATLKRLLDAHLVPHEKGGTSSASTTTVNCNEHTVPGSPDKIAQH